MSYAGVSKDYNSSITVEGLTINSQSIRKIISSYINEDHDTAIVDSYVRAYYKNNRDFLWINRYGVKRQADTLIAFLDTADVHGFNVEKYAHYTKICDNVERIKKLSFADDEGDAFNEALANVEYFLTKAFFRYAVGLRYGVTNPHSLLNNFDVKEKDSLHTTFHKIFDIDTHIVGNITLKDALSTIQHDSVSVYLHQAQPKDPLYDMLKTRLKTANGSEREKILVNMERARWRSSDAPYMNKEYVIVNVPAYHLWAVSEDSILDMKVGCGSHATKTPLLHSYIDRMDINPQWIIPRSIVQNDIIHHAGNAEYFNTRKYFARHRKTGQRLNGENITYDVLASNDYSIVQEGGEGNALGRIIFRFPNNFSVYLHDTSSRSFFARDDRRVSHGCIRVEKPYELACFMLRGKDDSAAEKIYYSMNNDIKAPETDRSLLISSVKVTPKMPVFITYFTLFMTPTSELRSYNDVYGYDEVLLRYIRNF